MAINKFTVVGHLVDDLTEQPVAGATIVVETLTPRQYVIDNGNSILVVPVSAVTDAQGRFEVRLISQLGLVYRMHRVPSTSVDDQRVFESFSPGARIEFTALFGVVAPPSTGIEIVQPDVRYATVDRLNAAITAARVRSSHTGLQPASTISDLADVLRPYITEAEVREALEQIPEPDLAPYLKIADLPAPPDLTPYAKTDQVNQVLTGYVTDDMLADALEAIPDPDLTPYALKTDALPRYTDDDVAEFLEGQTWPIAKTAGLQDALDAMATVTALASETSARVTADAAEASARVSADTAETEARVAHATDKNNPHAVTKNQVGLGMYPGNPNALGVSTATAAALSAKADLVDVNGVMQVPTSQIPSVALTVGTVVADRAAMLALTNVQKGDIVVIPNGADKNTYILGEGSSSDFASWIPFSSPTDLVTSVNGMLGPVVLGAADVGAPSLANNLSDLPNKATARQSLGLGTASVRDVGYFDLAGVAAAAQAYSIQRANHTGVQAISTVTGLQTSLDEKAARLANLSDLADAAAARANLGLGTAAVRALEDFEPAFSTLSSKTIDVSNTARLRADRFTLVDQTDGTKAAVFNLVGLTAGITRTYSLPNASATFAALGLAQTWTGVQTFNASATFNGGLNISSGIVLSQNVRFGTTTTTAATQTLTSASTVIQVYDATNNAISVTMLSTTLPGIIYELRKADATANVISFSGIYDGVAGGLNLTQPGQTVRVMSTATSGSWLVLSSTHRASQVGTQSATTVDETATRKWLTDVERDKVAGLAKTDVQVFLADGTWIKPAGARSVEVKVIGPGGPGGGGGLGLASAAVATTGGGGGGGGAAARMIARASSLPDSVAVIVPAPNAPGTGRTGTAAASGIQSGNAALQTSFGNIIVANGGGRGGAGGSSAGGAGGSAAGQESGTAGGSTTTGAAAVAGTASNAASSGGGGGGRTDSAGARGSGASGGAHNIYPSALPGAAGAAPGVGLPGNNGGDGGTQPAGLPGPGGGGGSAANSNSVAGNGGTGGLYGGGGGGGGSAWTDGTTSATSGNGGAGGPGICVVTTYF